MYLPQDVFGNIRVLVETRDALLQHSLDALAQTNGSNFNQIVSELDHARLFVVIDQHDTFAVIQVNLVLRLERHRYNIAG